MAPPADRRARKKAQTRSEVLAVAQRLFAEHGFDAVTVADIAAAADVAVQTVFNHFAGKEELFFAGRTPWLDGPAEAVRARPAGTTPLAALHAYTTVLLRELVEESRTAERRAVAATLAGSPALRAALPAVQQQAEQRLAAALVEPWQDATGNAPHEARMTAALTAALWVAAARTLLGELRAAADDDAAAVRAAVERMAPRVFDRLEADLAPLLTPPG